MYFLTYLQSSFHMWLQIYFQRSKSWADEPVLKWSAVDWGSYDQPASAKLYLYWRLMLLWCILYIAVYYILYIIQYTLYFVHYVTLPYFSLLYYEPASENIYFTIPIVVLPIERLFAYFIYEHLHSVAVCFYWRLMRLWSMQCNAVVPSILFQSRLIWSTSIRLGNCPRCQPLPLIDPSFPPFLPSAPAHILHRAGRVRAFSTDIALCIGIFSNGAEQY